MELAATAVLRLAERVTYRAEDDPEFPRRFPGALRITLAGGHSEEWREPVNRGSAERPLAPGEVREKFRQNARLALPDDRIERLISAVENVDRADGVGELAALCRAPR